MSAEVIAQPEIPFTPSTHETVQGPDFDTMRSELGQLNDSSRHIRGVLDDIDPTILATRKALAATTFKELEAGRKLEPFQKHLEAQVEIGKQIEAAYDLNRAIAQETKERIQETLTEKRETEEARDRANENAAEEAARNRPIGFTPFTGEQDTETTNAEQTLAEKTYRSEAKSAQSLVNTLDQALAELTMRLATLDGESRVLSQNLKEQLVVIQSAKSDSENLCGDIDLSTLKKASAILDEDSLAQGTDPVKVIDLFKQAVSGRNTTNPGGGA